MSSGEAVRPIEREGMPREVVAWLQTLHLPRAVRFPKRDLSNGFLVALICSRYWDSISMHSYEDRMSAAQKRSNWELLRKQFALNHCPLSDRMIDGMMAARDDYADSFLRQLYTQLTGRVIVEAAPLPAQVTATQTFVPHSVPQVTATKINVDFTPSAADAPQTSMRVRELRSSTAVNIPVPDGTPHVALANKHVIRGITREKEDSGGGGGGACTDDGSKKTREGRGDGNDSVSDNNNNRQNGKPPVDFTVSLRRAEVRQTVVRGSSKENRQKSGLENKMKQQHKQQGSRHGDDDGQPVAGAYDETALGMIESIVRTQSAGQDWMCAYDDEPCAFTNYFLREEARVGALIQCRVWSALLGSVNDLTELVLRYRDSIADIAAIFLRKFSPEKMTGQQEQEQDQKHTEKMESSPSSQRRWTSKVSPKWNSMSQRFAFVASLLSGISDVDTFLAVSIYCDEVLPYSKEGMCALDYVSADGYASLLCAALPPNRKHAAQILPDVFLAVHNTLMMECSTNDAKQSYYLFLRAVLLRLTRLPRRESSRLTRSSSRTTSVVARMVNDPLLTAAITAIGYKVVDALTNESSMVRLVGAHLAESLAIAGCSPVLLFDVILPLLSGCRKWPYSAPLSCVCATWTRVAIKRFGLPLDEEEIRDTEYCGPIDEEELYTRAAPHLASIMEFLCNVLLAPGPMDVKVFIAKQMLFCLDNIPEADNMKQLFRPEKLAAAVFTVFNTAPSELLATFIAIPSSPDGSGRITGRNNEQLFSTSEASSLLGPLVVEGYLADCYPLALSEAVLMVLPPECSRRSSIENEKTGKTVTVSRHNSNSSGGDVTDGTQMTSRQIIGKAMLLLKNRAVPADVSRRVTWMYKIIVACRNGSNFPMRPTAISEEAAAQRWHKVMRQMYNDITVLAEAAEMICTQKGGLTDGATNAIAQMAGMAQQIVVWWYTELRKEDALVLRSSPVTSSNSTERLAETMGWYQNLFGVASSRDQPHQKQQQQQQQQQSRRISTVSPRKSVSKG